MDVGIPKGIRNREHRAGLTPLGVKSLVQKGIASSWRAAPGWERDSRADLAEFLLSECVEPRFVRQAVYVVGR